MSIIKSIVEKLKLKELFAIIFIAAIVITVLPNDLAEKMKINTFRNTYQTYISLCMIAIGGYYVLHLLGWTKNCIWDKFYNWKRVRFLYKGIIIKHNKTEPTYTKTSLFLCEKRRFFMARTKKGGKSF